MNTTTYLAGFARNSLLAIAACALLTLAARAQVPQMISYQGRVTVSGTNFTGSGQFKFALVQGAGPTLLWKNDGSAGNTEPAAVVTLPVSNGLVMTLLGDTTLPNMTAIPGGIFLSNGDVRLRVWFNGGLGNQQLSPDTRIVSVGYAMMAANVPNGSITAAKLAVGVLNPTNFPANSVTSLQLANDVDLGATNSNGRLDVYRTSANTPAVSLIGSASQISTYGADGLEQIRLWGPGYGEILLNNSLANNETAVLLTAQGTSGGQLELRNTNGSVRARLEGENTGGALTLFQTDGQTGLFLDGDSGGAGLISVRGTNGGTRATLDGSDGGGGATRLYENDGTETVTITSQGNGNAVLRQGDGSTGIALGANNGTGGGGLSIYRDNGAFAGQFTIADVTRGDAFLGLAKGNGNWGITMRGQNSSTGGGAIYLYDSTGAATIVLDSDSADEGHIYTQVLTITGGADLSENFNVNAAVDELRPGMVVSIDPKNPGELTLCRSAYDKKVAGVVSGAGGVKPGMLMSQAGSVADGKHPVALTGRVYCWIDADAGGAIEPGDLITTSATPGHGMKASDSARSSGAVIGKAMTALEKGKGLTLVLVNLQ